MNVDKRVDKRMDMLYKVTGLCLYIQYRTYLIFLYVKHLYINKLIGGKVSE